MSKLSKAVKKYSSKPLKTLTNVATLGQRDKLEKAYRKSGLRDIYEKNKSAILQTGGLLAASTLAPGLVTALPGSGLGLLAAAAGTGALKDKKRAAKASAAKKQEEQQRQKNIAGDQLDDLLEGISGGDPNAPITGGNPTVPGYVSTQPVQPPSSGNMTLPVVPSFNQAPPTAESPYAGGITQTGGQASIDQNRLLEEAILQKQLQEQAAGTSKASREQMLQEYADLISAQQNRILDENTPALYEDLNTRGLLRSSELGNAMARERAKAAAILQENVGLQGLTDREAYIKSIEDANTNYLSGRSGAIQRGLSLEDFARQTKAAQLTGQALAPISTGTPSSKAGDAAMVSAGANVATALKGK